MFCPSCGAQCADGVRFCNACGAPVSDGAISGQPAPAPAPQAYVAPAPQAQPYVVAPAASSAATPAQTKQKSKLGLGLIGALVGGLICAALIAIVYHLGYFSALCSLVGALCIFGGYMLLGKGLDVKGFVVCVIVLLLAVFLGWYLGLALDVHDVLKDYGYSLIDVCLNLNSMFSHGVLGAGGEELAMHYLFALLGGGGLAWSYFKKSR